MVTKYRVITSRGYDPIMDIPFEPKSKIKIPILPRPKVKPPVITLEDITLVASVLGRPEKWSGGILKRAKYVFGDTHLPDSWEANSNRRIITFLKELYRTGGIIGTHRSGSSEFRYPEAIFRTRDEKFAWQVHRMWWRLGVLMKVVEEKDGWAVKTSGTRSYVNARLTVLGKIQDPQIQESLRKADLHVPFEYRIFEAMYIADIVVSCEEIEVEELEEGTGE